MITVPKLTLEDVKIILEGAEKKAKEIGVDIVRGVGLSSGSVEEDRTVGQTGARCFYEASEERLNVLTARVSKTPNL
jgi:uncharacterized protein GlcG (DUF336 family)